MNESVAYKPSNLDALRADVHETTNVLKITVDKLVERGDRLDAVNARADALSESSGMYHSSTRRVNRHMKWKNYKITMIIVAVVIIVVGLIILVIVHPWDKK